MSDLLSFFLLFWLSTCFYSLWRGGGPERLVAALFLAAVPASMALLILPWRVREVHLGIAAVDLLMLVALLPVAWRANRLWPLAMAGLQGLQVVGHLLKLSEPTALPPILYWLTSAFWAYPMLALLLVAAIRHRARERTFGPEPSWTTSSRTFPQTPTPRSRD